LYECSKEEVEEYEALIRERNRFAHASGKILDEENIDKTIQRYNVLMDKIQNKSSYVVECCFKQEEGKYFEFLEEGNQVDQDFTINIIEPFLFSVLDIKIVLDYLKFIDYKKINEIENFLEIEGIIDVHEK
jgi:hypothetical protein